MLRRPRVEGKLEAAMVDVAVGGRNLEFWGIKFAVFPNYLGLEIPFI